MEVNFTEAKWSADSGGSYLMIKLPPEVVQSFIDSMKPDKKYTLNIKQYRKKRSKDANAYFWEMCGQLAEKTKSTPVEIYREFLRCIGDNFEVVPIKTERVQSFIEAWGTNGIGWVCDILGESSLEGYTNVVAYWGSSTYDSKQMSALIDFLIQECKEQGINTDTPQMAALIEGGYNGR